MLINSFFTRGGLPVIGITPLISIWEVSTTAQTKVINSDAMTAIGEGLYYYTFAAFDPLKEYVYVANGGGTLPPNERIVISSSSTASSTTLNAADVMNIVDGVWDATAVNYMTAGSTGQLLNTTNASVQQLVLDMFALMAKVETLLDMECNRTLIDKTAKTLTVFQDDGVTPLKVFDLYDSNGVASVVEVCERIPQ